MGGRRDVADGEQRALQFLGARERLELEVEVDRFHFFDDDALADAAERGRTSLDTMTTPDLVGRVEGEAANFAALARAVLPLALALAVMSFAQPAANLQFVAAVALTKARLFQDIQDRRRLTEDLYALTQAMDRSMDLQERVEIFAASALRALSTCRRCEQSAFPSDCARRLRPTQG